MDSYQRAYTGHMQKTNKTNKTPIVVIGCVSSGVLKGIASNGLTVNINTPNQPNKCGLFNGYIVNGSIVISNH